MRLLVTGASGWIGSAVVPELLDAGHEVVGLVRSDESARRVESLGAGAVRGSIDDPAGVAALAADTEGVVHLAYHHDFSEMARAAELDRAVIAAIGETFAGSGRPLLIASGTLGLASGRTGTENDRPDPNAHPRVANAEAALGLADQGVRSIVARFAPTVHGPGDHGFMARLVEIARERGISGYVGDGENRWPAVHRLDAGALVRLAIEKAEPATVVHAVAEEGVPARAIAEAIGHGLDVPVESIPAERAGEHFGWLGAFFAADAPASNDVTRERFGWQPHQRTLIEDLEAGAYF